MLIREELARVRPAKDTVLTLGVFDGVHLGHRSLIGRVKDEAQARGLLSGVLTFDRHPLELLSPGNQPTYLTGKMERLRSLEALGPDFLLVISFTDEAAALSARDFVGLLQEHLRMRGMVIGPDFALGRGREGTIPVMRRLGEEMGFFVEVAPPLIVEGQVVSSTAIRRALAEGDMGAARRLLGRPFSLQGQVVAGSARGRSLGFPTANLPVHPERAFPPDGVYAAKAFLDGRVGYVQSDSSPEGFGPQDGVSYAAAAYIGRRPTFGDGQRGVEVFLLDFSGDLYGKNLQVEFLERLRPDHTFANAAALQTQIEEDVRRIRAVLGGQRG